MQDTDDKDEGSLSTSVGYKRINPYGSAWKNPESRVVPYSQIEGRIKTCDFSSCEAMCCYDGVYLKEGDQVRIDEAITKHPEYFEHLPVDYIVQGEWNDIKGLKTNTRPFNYKSNLFPAHFNKTRCVFADDSGTCSLESVSREQTEHKWTYKPTGCIKHPLNTNLEFGTEDENNIDTSYPGFSTYTECGIEKLGGKKWQEELNEEVEYLKNFRST